MHCATPVRNCVGFFLLLFFCFLRGGGVNAGALKNEQRTKMSSESAQVKAQVYNYVTAVTAQTLV